MTFHQCSITHPELDNNEVWLENIRKEERYSLSNIHGIHLFYNIRFGEIEYNAYDEQIDEFVPVFGIPNGRRFQ